MPKHVVVVSTSLRKGNSAALAAAFADGAREAGHTVEEISLSGKNLGFCRGCLACQSAKTGHCVMRDDADELAQSIGKADVVAFATPIYFYEMSGQMKVLLDRTNPLFCIDYAFRDVYLLAAAAENDPSAMDGALQGLQGWVECFEGAKLAGTAFAGGVTDCGDVSNHPALEEARTLGREIV